MEFNILKNNVKNIMQQFSDEGMTFYSIDLYINMREVDAINFLKKDFFFHNMELMVFASIFSLDNKNFKVFLVKKPVIFEKRKEIMNLLLKFKNLVEVNSNMVRVSNLNCVEFSKKISSFFFKKIYKKYVYIPVGFQQNMRDMSSFLDSCLHFSTNLFLQPPFLLEPWALKYISVTILGDLNNTVKNLIYLDFCYNELFISNGGIYKYEGKEFFQIMTFKKYYDTFYIRVSTLKEKSTFEFFGVSFGSNLKAEVLSILENEMDFFLCD